jgi:inhibitor of cysteine peptidase
MAEGAIHQVDDSRSDAVLEVARGDAIDVRLAENATTGFRWRIKADGGPLLALEEDRTSSDAKNRPGAGGSRRWRFRAASAGHATIELAYARRVPANAEPAKTFVLRVRVLP